MPEPFEMVDRRRAGSSRVLCMATALITVMSLSIAAGATEKNGSVYPVGVETVMPGLVPPPHGTMLFEFTAVYSANELDNSLGKSADPEFKVRVLADAFKLVHNWNVPVLGGQLNSNIAVPTIYQQLHVAPGYYSKSGLSNVIFGVFQVGYQKGSLNWFYEGDVYFPGAPFAKADVLNIGQHNYAVAPVGGFTYLPRHGSWEGSSKLEYIVNFDDTASHYRSGNEFTWEYDGMKQFNKKVAAGANGYLYLQTTDDLQNGLRVGDANRGRDLAIGPELRFFFGQHGAFALKYFRDTLVENKPRGNAFWFQLGIPVNLLRGR